MAVIKIYGEIGWQVDLASIDKQLAGVPDTEDLTIEIHSPGGAVDEGWAIYNRLAGWKGKKTTVILGQACSMAAFIFLVGDEKKAYKNCMLMFHRCWGGTIGDAKETEKQAEILREIDRLTIEKLQTHTGKNAEDIEALIESEWYMIGGDTIKDNGFVSEVIDEVKIKQMKKNYVFSLKKMEVNNMTLEELQAALEALQAAHEELKARVDELEKVEPETEPVPDPEEKADVQEILEIAGIEVTSEMKKVLSGEMKVNDFAMSELKKARSNKVQQISGVKTVVTPKETPKSETEKKASEITKLVLGE